MGRRGFFAREGGAGGAGWDPREDGWSNHLEECCKIKCRHERHSPPPPPLAFWPFGGGYSCSIHCMKLDT